MKRMPEHASPLPAPPPGSSATLEREGEAVRIDVPAAGLLKGSFGLIVFGPALVLVAVVSVGRIVMAEGGIEPLNLAWFVLLGLAGVAMTLAAQFLGLRAFRVEADRRRVALVTRHVFGGSRREVDRAELDRVVVGEAPFTAKNRPVVRLEVWTRRGVRHTAMTARSPAEVAWVADVLAEVLELPGAGRTQEVE